MLRTIITSTLSQIATLLTPVTAFANSSYLPVPPGTSLTLSTLVTMVIDVVNTFITIAMVVTVAMIIYAGFRMGTAAGNEKQFTEGKATLTNAIIGLVVMLGVGIIIRTIDNFAVNPTSILR